jgi:alkylated DNA repair dioxygenase AlkB
MNQIEQLAMFSSKSGSEVRPKRTGGALWLGLAVDHWQLFDALQDEWLRPPAGSAGRVLGVRAFAGEASLPRAGNRISTHLKVDLDRLPRVDVLVRRGGKWSVVRLDEVRGDDRAVAWPGPLPISAISEILVSTNEEQARLAALTRQVSNVALPEPVCTAPREDVPWVDEAMPTDELPRGLRLPPDLDAVHGALAMAIWAVPRVDPWLDLLVAGLGFRWAEALELARDLDASWWAYAPWRSVPTMGWPDNREERLWLAAVEVFRGCTPGKAMAAVDVARNIAATAARGGSDADESALSAWVDGTLRILSADAIIQLDDWKSNPVGKAIQLVLARPVPTSFKGWFDDLPGLPPAIWWSAATLCGLLHGYRRLDVHFRGSALQRRFLAVQALRAADPDMAAVAWPGAPSAAPLWRREPGRVVLSWDGDDFANKKDEHGRGHWFVADMNDPEVEHAAKDLARRNDWMERDVVFLDGTRMRLPRGAKIEEVFEAEAFRRRVATEGGAIPSPPPTPRQSFMRRPESSIDEKSPDKVPAAAKKPSSSAFLRGVEEADRAAPDERVEPQRGQLDRGRVEVPGFIYVPYFLDAAQEEELRALIDEAPWIDDLKRRVQHYGWRYSYKARRVDASMRLGPLPIWALKLAQRLFDEGRLPHLADQVIVNEYIGTQGISKHIDCIPCFADGIAMISLLESWEINFTCAGRKAPRLLERGSVAVMTGDARYRWYHEIPHRQLEPHGLRRIRRISITFRKVNFPPL